MNWLILVNLFDHHIFLCLPASWNQIWTSRCCEAAFRWSHCRLSNRTLRWTCRCRTRQRASTTRAARDEGTPLVNEVDTCAVVYGLQAKLQVLACRTQCSSLLPGREPRAAGEGVRRRAEALRTHLHVPLPPAFPDAVRNIILVDTFGKISDSSFSRNSAHIQWNAIRRGAVRRRSSS